MANHKPSPRISSFPPLGNKNASILILGSMPGEASLAANQYYAHPRNQFWLIIGELIGIKSTLPYEERVEALIKSRIILWESLQSCIRKGSLDSAILEEIPNDFHLFLAQHNLITHIFFNGAKAEHSFRRHVLPDLNRPDITFKKLPSTSPAHAGMSYAAKLEKWKEAFEGT